VCHERFLTLNLVPFNLDLLLPGPQPTLSRRIKGKHPDIPEPLRLWAEEDEKSTLSFVGKFQLYLCSHPRYSRILTILSESKPSHPAHHIHLK
jgi:hypothetical protein